MPETALHLGADPRHKTIPDFLAAIDIGVVPDAVFDPYARLEGLGLKLDTRKLRADWFNATRRSGDLLFTSGQIADSSSSLGTTRSWFRTR